LDDPGVPDLLVGIKHVITKQPITFLVEVKGPSGKLTNAQTEFFKTFKGEKYVIRTPDEFIWLLFTRTGYAQWYSILYAKHHEITLILRWWSVMGILSQVYIHLKLWVNGDGI